MTPSTRGSDCVTSTSTAATDAVRRVYFREKQREHRMKNRSKHSRLMQRVHDLEKVLRLATMSTTKLPPRKRPLSNQRDLLLPWKVVADVMKQELEASEACQVILRDRIDMSVAVIRDMQRFASLHHMYLNKDAVFQHFAFPPLSSPERVQEYDLVFTESDCYYLLQRSHLTFDVPMEALRRMNHEHLCSLLLLADSTSNDEKVETSTNEYIHMIELTRISPRQTKVRALSIISQSRRKHGLVPLDEEATHLGLVDTTHVSDRRFRTQLLARTSLNSDSVNNNDIPAILAKITAELPAS
ncbi:hypothetical protein DYB30_008369 [Aphanomyces astaci]|uniref:Uncharacterized protein n=1 Tax=Aphanomyces astaci TaxID=112090 RepID=A0A397EIX1_APHAT|nr:hypothetical protein DYB30_008369 [Aphanomyces astaci]RHY93519.1 hypothetical protein DYB31_008145 [Aphanomyces astaci]RHZ01803.1 hypothetical protein DYB26_005806 [Aphanomyces astaci]